MSTLQNMGGSRRRGIALIWLAITFLVLVAIVGLAIDMSVAVYGKQQLQNAADAAALAGAALVQVDITQARSAALTVSLANKVYKDPVQLNLNEANSNEGDIVVGYYDRDVAVFTPTEVSPNAMQVFARRTAEAHGALPLVFGPICGVGQVDAWTEAIAMVGGDTGAGMLVLDPYGQCSAQLGGNVTVNVTDISVEPNEPGTIHINSDHSAAICADGKPDIEAGLIEVVGGTSLGNADYDGEIETGASVVQDPLRNLPAVPWQTLPEVPVPSGNTTVAPGYHPGTVKRTGGTLTLESGVHVFDSLSSHLNSVAFEISGTGGVVSPEGGGVMLYIVRGSLNLVGTGQVRLDPLNAPVGSPDAVWNGVTIFQARDNYCESSLAGGSGMDLTGTLYFPNNRIRIRGDGGGYGNQLIAWQVDLYGNGEIRIMYDGRFPAPGTDVFLVK